MQIKQTTTGLVFFCITGSLLLTIVTVNGEQYSNPRPTRNCQQYRSRRGEYEITGNDDSVYCYHQHLYQSALGSSPNNASIVYVQTLLEKALSRCDGSGSKYGHPRQVKKKCRKGRCRRKNKNKKRGKKVARKPTSYNKIKYGRITPNCAWERKEVRTMSRSEWNRFTRRLNILKRPIRNPGGGSFIPYDVISDIHRSDSNLDAAHGGPSFLGWHRVYLLILESAIGVPVPYWDSRLDYDMAEPTDSMLWTDEFFGPGFGIVDSGPFAGWITADNVSLVRNIGSGGSLMSASMVEEILRYRNHDPIVEPTRRSISLERIHGGPHVWVDGQLSSLQTAPQEPVFFLHHSFVDYIWYLFRVNMRKNENINPSTDYPNKGPRSHGRNENMIPFGDLRNIQGYSDFLESLTRYRPSPTCPSCGRSKYLECDRGINRCKSKPKRKVVTPSGASGQRRRRLGTVLLGTKFISPQTDPRTSGNVLSFGPLLNRTLLV
ncbi:tyrosinase-like protein 2 [Mizuhopecten yessoensis]|uniref:Tyrosinase-like protein tyr-3 n=1 Tax=Mizuhopecten yessoensis TaxID=6573 RepID=A0A210QJN1_MIZYE|nr:tyrosinase-like protein 2 [Mizuhopecten yessoensis]OWF48968.1 tyrosinase-like protein tyr-3 [Mizuhopecten yessoensis]